MAEPTKNVAEKPKVLPAEARLAKVMSVLGSQKGWSFVSETAGELRCEATGLRMTKGVVIKNAQTGKQVTIGRGVAKKYTDVQLPSGRKAKEPAAPG